MKNDRDKEVVLKNFEKQLMSTFFSGVYLSVGDIVKIANNLGIKLPYKRRDILLSKLSIEAKKVDKYNKYTKEIIKLIDKRVNEFKSLVLAYPQSSDIVNSWIKRANGIKLLIERERVYE